MRHIAAKSLRAVVKEEARTLSKLILHVLLEPMLLTLAESDGIKATIHAVLTEVGLPERWQPRQQTAQRCSCLRGDVAAAEGQLLESRVAGLPEPFQEFCEAFLAQKLLLAGKLQMCETLA